MGLAGEIALCVARGINGGERCLFVRCVQQGERDTRQIGVAALVGRASGPTVAVDRTNAAFGFDVHRERCRLVELESGGAAHWRAGEALDRLLFGGATQRDQYDAGADSKDGYGDAGEHQALAPLCRNGCGSAYRWNGPRAVRRVLHCDGGWRRRCSRYTKR